MSTVKVSQNGRKAKPTPTFEAVYMDGIGYEIYYASPVMRTQHKISVEEMVREANRLEHENTKLTHELRQVKQSLLEARGQIPQRHMDMRRRIARDVARANHERKQTRS